MATSNKRAEKGAGPADKALKVVSRRPSFWRAGIEFTAEPKILPLNEITEAQREAICLEGLPGGQLVVNLVDTPAAEKA